MENKVKVWIARDKDGSLWAYPTTPFREDDMWFCDEPITQLDSLSFPSIKREDDEPTEAYITLAEPQPEKEQPKQEQPKPKQEIDWEQRRYEIAKEMMPIIYWHGMEAQKHGQSVKRKDTVYYAVIFADMLIQKLKEQSDEL